VLALLQACKAVVPVLCLPQLSLCVAWLQVKQQGVWEDRHVVVHRAGALELHNLFRGVTVALANHTKHAKHVQYSTNAANCCPLPTALILTTMHALGNSTAPHRHNSA
jgi:hypothetical protein